MNESIISSPIIIDMTVFMTYFIDWRYLSYTYVPANLELRSMKKKIVANKNWVQFRLDEKKNRAHKLNRPQQII